jgi:hypothetical protein
LIELKHSHDGLRLQPIHHRIYTNKFDAARLLSEPEELVELATEAPSSLNIQHWRFGGATTIWTIP